MMEEDLKLLIAEMEDEWRALKKIQSTVEKLFGAFYLLASSMIRLCGAFAHVRPPDAVGDLIWTEHVYCRCALVDLEGSLLQELPTDDLLCDALDELEDEDGS